MASVIGYDLWFNSPEINRYASGVSLIPFDIILINPEKLSAVDVRLRQELQQKLEAALGVDSPKIFVIFPYPSVSNQGTTPYRQSFPEALNYRPSEREYGSQLTIAKHPAYFNELATLLNTKTEYFCFLNVEKEDVPLAFIEKSTHVVAKFKKVKNHLVLYLPFIRQDILTIIPILKTLHQELFQESSEGAPEWVKAHLILDEPDIVLESSKIGQEIIKLQMKLSALNQDLEKISKIKSLIWGTGIKPLQFQVTEIFNLMGLNAEPGPDGRDDIILKYGSHVAVCEVKGVTKSSGERDATQLEKWVSSYHDTNGIEPKGILIVNAYRELPLANRTDEAFPDQMLEYCRRKELCLVTTTQLLGLFSDFSKKMDIEPKIQSLFSHVGKWPHYTDWSQFVFGGMSSEHTNKVAASIS